MHVYFFPQFKNGFSWSNTEDVINNIFADDDSDMHVSALESSKTDKSGDTNEAFNSLQIKIKNLASSLQGNSINRRTIRTKSRLESGSKKSTSK